MVPREGLNDRDVIEGDHCTSALNAPFVALADARVLQSHSAKWIGIRPPNLCSA